MNGKRCDQRLIFPFFAMYLQPSWAGQFRERSELLVRPVCVVAGVIHRLRSVLSILLC